ncbi:MAG: methyltransferase domain-containing protein [Eubacterium sp.]|nr:methyltransferase domain-containing protein [Eubacterium sp.]
MLCCPICGGALAFEDKATRCAKNHSFDIAREGYINLLRSAKSGDLIGDNKDSARSRRDFLNKGYYAPLKDALSALFADKRGTVLDICCGEGYYTSALGENPELCVYGFDISKEMIRLAAKRGGATYFVANMAAIPVADESFDWAVHLFAPFHEREFARILKPGGTLYSVIPGSRHLWGLKTKLYDTPYLNDEKLPVTDMLALKSKQKVSANITLNTAQDIDSVFRMTPYYYHTSRNDKSKLESISALETEIEFVIAEYVKM